ncbi:MAG: hypothetical protein JNL51_10575 [Chitinophagaceae bacterium]|nr:hypothetical protein [Chitinophagaceae bacterium]
MYKKIKLLGIAVLAGISLLQAQTENSPYSRYGLGDELPQNNIITRGMGGVSAAYYDYQSINFQNPASYSKLRLTTFDFGVELDSRTLRVIDPPRKFSSSSPTISYLQLGFPLSKKGNWGMNLGLNPVTRINYKLERRERLPGIDSVNTLFEGNGGAYEVFAGTGVSIKSFSIGINAGYMFGTKEYSAERHFIPDSIDVLYYPSSSRTHASYGGLFLQGGIQYNLKLSKASSLQFGAYGNLKREFNGTKDVEIETYSASERGNLRIDSVYIHEVSGKVIKPASYGGGLLFNKHDKWMIGMDFSTAKWSEYTFFNEKDSVQDSWKLHFGGQIIPNAMSAKSYWSRVSYRAGFSYGRDYIRVNDDLPAWTVSFGAAFPMRRANYSNQYSVINTAIEFGQRGNNLNIIRENFLRISVGLSLSDIWFIKKQYD